MHKRQERCSAQSGHTRNPLSFIHPKAQPGSGHARRQQQLSSAVKLQPCIGPRLHLSTWCMRWGQSRPCQKPELPCCTYLAGSGSRSACWYNPPAPASSWAGPPAASKRCGAVRCCAVLCGSVSKRASTEPGTPLRAHPFLPVRPPVVPPGRPRPYNEAGRACLLGMGCPPAPQPADRPQHGLRAPAA